MHWLVRILLLIVCATASAEAPADQALAEMDHKVWTARDGAPQGINALAQGADGTLWIGSDSGLYNFDGRAFASYQSPAGQPDFPVDPVRTLCVARDGTLWVGFFQAGVAHIAEGRVSVWFRIGDSRMGVLDNLGEARDGSIWAVSAQRRILRFGPDSNWHEEPQPASGGKRLHAVLDSSDTLWVAQGARLYRRDVRDTRYIETKTSVDWMFGITEQPDGTIWIADYDGQEGEGRLQHIDRLGALIARVPEVGWAPRAIAYRGDGSLVYASQFNGLRAYPRELLHAGEHSVKGAAPENFAERNGLSSDAIGALFSATDGTLWVGSSIGLERFRPGSFTPFVTEHKGGTWSICANDREVWLAHLDDHLYRVAGGRTQILKEPEGASSVTCGSDGHTWMVNRTGGWHVYGDQVKALPAIPGVEPYGMEAIAAMSDHTLVATVGGTAAVGGGVWQFKQGRWTKFSGPDVLSASGIVEYVDSQNRVWMGYRDKIGLPTSSGGRILPAEGLGLVYAFLETSRGFFAAGSNGLAVLRDPRFELLAFEDEQSTRGLNGLVEARNGDLWLNASRGIVRIPASELRSALARPGHRMKTELVTEGDFAGLTVTITSTASAARDRDGRLWFVTRNGVFHIDPEHRGSDIRPPIVSIRSITADRVPLGAERTLGPRPQTLEIRYFGVHMMDPDRVVYKYRLAGLESGWQDAGGRTGAFYTRLAPGSYTFQVMASSGNDVWTAPVTSLPFVVLPSFYQTTWFRVACVIIGLALAFGIFSLRVRAITRSVRARAEERADERIRIARELHDTLLQGIQGLLLNFHVAAQRLAADDVSKAMLERTLSTADRIIVEGRNRVSSLRSERLTDGELVASLENAGRDLRGDADVQFSVKRKEGPLTLIPPVADEIFWIAREAVANAFRHSGASRVTVELIYGPRYFSMVCTDNGAGFDTTNGEKQGHWGLRGMSERARKLGGQLECRSDSAHGTQIAAIVPSYRAYEHQSRLMFYLRALVSWKHAS